MRKVELLPTRTVILAMALRMTEMICHVESHFKNVPIVLMLHLVSSLSTCIVCIVQYNFISLPNRLSTQECRFWLINQSF